MVDLLLKSNSTLPHLLAKDQNGLTALLAAVMKGREPVVKLLLEANSQVLNSNEQQLLVRNKWDRTALMEASLNGHADVVVDRLLNTNSNELHLFFKDSEGRTALMIASLNVHAPVADRLLISNSKEQRLLARDNSNRTALMLASIELKETVEFC